ncbi:protein of unknown function (DUF4261) [Abditibacterium utsteinense]|uniref:DUF4261 domain-containing protein n=1 Tax=Abditibacterium utsteinense TaxID=1960156 RepID=A0A2S8SUC5_9BACT|nr:DUF4261 domain-containing protein [Abditibacterium utsteinense]PQV64386.1 protein of unknown function (DUF4261) [Abditibacterium utsteinense]
MGISDAPKSQKSPAPVTISESSQVSLQVLFAAPFSPSSDELTRSLRAYDASLNAATVSLVDGGEGSALGEARFGIHAVQIVVFGFPMPKEPLEACVLPAPFDQETKQQVRAQQAHALLFYRGQSENISEQYIALALVAGALCGHGGLAVLNKNARAALPARVFTPEMGASKIEFFDTLPPLYLFAGFVKYEIEGKRGVWMRTHGLQLWDLPNLATLVESHARGAEVFDIFSNVIDYMINKGPILCAGHTMQIGEDIYIKLREPGAEEAKISDENELLIADFIRADESNPFVFNL